MQIAEIFYSIQGEGELTGVPSVFVRTSGCNLRCRWCDTPYASWNPEGTAYEPDALLARILEHSQARHVVFTGGEPLLWKELPDLSRNLRSRGWHVTIETAATISPASLEYDLASLSPKLSSSTPLPHEIDTLWRTRHEKSRLQPSVLREWLLGGAYQLKFVISQESDLAELEQILEQTGVSVPAHKVFLMPEGTESASLRESGRQVAEWCKERGYRFCDRLHVHLYGHTRGT
jgi:7-carboxy-7-deazaguanine synthase